MSADEKSTSSSDPGSKSKFTFDEDNLLIAEVRRRRALWDRKHKNYGKQQIVNMEYAEIGKIINKSPDEAKARFQFFKRYYLREEMKLILPEVNEGMPLIYYYTGFWVYFEKLLFLYEKDKVPKPYVRTREVLKKKPEQLSQSSEAVVNEECPTKAPFREEEFSETCVNDDVTNDVKSDIRASETQEDEQITYQEDVSHYNDQLQVNDDADPDVQFVKSLVPFFKKINPLRRLIVKNEMQNILLKEMICDQCKIVGLQPHCQCNLK